VTRFARSLADADAQTARYETSDAMREEIRRLRQAHIRRFAETGRCDLSDGYSRRVPCSMHPEPSGGAR
jgi:hypothetical protein